MEIKNLTNSKLDNFEKESNFESNLGERDQYREIIEGLVQKKKDKKIVKASVIDFICVQWGCTPCKRRNEKKFAILEKCSSIIDTNIQINHIIRKLFELEFLKRLLLSEKQRQLIKYQFRYINLKNFEDSIKFLEILEEPEDEEFDKKLFDNIFQEKQISDEKDIDQQLVENLKLFYNF